MADTFNVQGLGYGLAPADPNQSNNAAFAAAVAAQKANREAVLRQTQAVRRQADELKRATQHTQAFRREVEQATQRNKLLAAQLRDGSFARHAAQVAQLGREYAKLQQTAHLQGLVAVHGKLGATVRANSDHFKTLGRTAAFGVAGAALMARSLVNAGLQGTVEGYRLEYAWTRLSRQMAGIAVPAVDKLADLVGGLATKFQGLNREQQDTILNLGLIAAGGAAAMAVLRPLAAVAGIAYGGAKILAGRFGGGVVAGGAAGGAGSAVAGGVAGGLAAKTAGGLGLGGLGAIALGGLGLVQNVRGLRAGAQTFAEAREAGLSPGRAFRQAGMQFANTVTFGAASEVFRFGRRQVDSGYAARQDALKPEPGKHTDVTPLQVATDDIGGAFDRIQEAVLRVTSAQKTEADAAAVETKNAVVAIKATLDKALEQRNGDVMSLMLDVTKFIERGPGR